jgi:hypothetical protein
LADERLQRVRAEDQRLLAAAGPQHAVSEDMAALRIHAELCLVDGGEGEITRKHALMRAILASADDGHALSGAQDIARAFRDDTLLAGDQGDVLRALDAADPLVDFAGQQPQREADYAAGMAAHPFDGEISLAGVGRPEDGPNEGVTGHGRECGSGESRPQAQSAELNRS